MKNILTAIILLSTSPMLFSQAGIQFAGGLTQSTNRDLMVTPQEMSHNGYFIGADAVLNEGKMYLILGGQFTSLSFLPQSENTYFGHDHKMNWIKLRTGLGFELLKISKSVALHSKVLGSVNILSRYPENILDAPYSEFNSGTAGLVFSIGLDIGNLGVMMEYERGFFNAVNDKKGTEFDFLAWGLTFRI